MDDYHQEAVNYQNEQKPYFYETYQSDLDQPVNHLLPLLTEKEKALFLEIYGALVNKNAISLLFMKGYLEEQSAKLRHVHPLSTLYFINQSPRMKYYLNKLRKKTIVTEPWDRSCKDFVVKMSHYKKKELLCLDDFLEKVEPEKKARTLYLIEEERFVELLVFYLQ